MKSILIKNTSIFKILQEHQIKQLDLIPKRECKGNDRFSYSNFHSQEQNVLFFFLIKQTQKEEKRTNLFIPTEKSSEEKSSFLKSEWKSCQLFSLKHSNSTYSPRLRSQNVNAFQERKKKSVIVKEITVQQ